MGLYSGLLLSLGLFVSGGSSAPLLDPVGPCRSSPTHWSNTSMQESYMRIAIDLARAAVRAGGGPYGALIADPTLNKVVALGMNHADHNPIWHGEMAAITNLSSALSSHSVYSVAPCLELYTTAEPCPMCMSAIAWSGFGRVVYGTSIPFIEAQGQEQIGIRAIEVARKAVKKVVVVGGVLANETNPLYQNTTGLHHRHAHPHIVEAAVPDSSLETLERRE
eukprot:Hpha_TRINITY_DN31614_c0_g1::TRINITY_DN31614_c0_g1_i1::g.29153::m.29153